MTHSTEQTVHDLLKVSRSLAQQATDGDWEAVAALENQQRTLVEQYAEQCGSKEITPECAVMLSDVQVYTDKVLELAKQQSNAITLAAQVIAKGKKAVTAYDAFSK